MIYGFIGVTIACGVVGLVVGWFVGAKTNVPGILQYRKDVEKYLLWIRLYDIWLSGYQHDKKIRNYLVEQGIHSISIYGMSYLGIRLYYELKDTDISVKYGIDRNKGEYVVGLEIKNPEDIKEPKEDAVIVTAVTAFDEINPYLQTKGFKKILAVDEVLYSLL